MTHFVLPDAWEYIVDTRDKVHDLEKRLQNSKDNVDHIKKIMWTWTKVPLFDRTEEKGSTLLGMKDREERTRKRYDEIELAGVKIHDLLKVFRQILSLIN